MTAELKYTWKARAMEIHDKQLLCAVFGSLSILRRNANDHRNGKTFTIIPGKS